MSQCFGLPSKNWHVTLTDLLKSPSDSQHARIVGEFTVAQMENTEVRFEETTVRNKKVYRAIGPDGQELPDVKAGFECDGTFYPVTGWIAYSKQPYKDDLMAGVRVYCRGKIAAQMRIFNLKAGFTGEYDIRSYLIGAAPRRLA